MRSIILHGLFYGGALAPHAAMSMGMTNPLVAETMGYSTALYLDAIFVVVALALIPFLRIREEGAQSMELEPVPKVD